MKRILLIAFFLLATAQAFATDLRADTAATIVIGPLVDSSDASAEESLTISQADVLLWKEGGTTFAQKNESTACTHRSNGNYTCPIDATDTNTEGVLVVSVYEAGTQTWSRAFSIIDAAIWDIKYGVTTLENLSQSEAQTAAAAALTTYDPPTAGELTSGLAGLNDLDAAGVRTAVGLASANLDSQLSSAIGGTVLFETVLDVITDQTHVQGPDEPFAADVDNAHLAKLACIEDVDTGFRDCAWINGYEADDDEWTLSTALRFTIAVGDILRITTTERIF